MWFCGCFDGGSRKKLVIGYLGEVRIRTFFVFFSFSDYNVFVISKN